jgi:hypothetical protein
MKILTRLSIAFVAGVLTVAVAACGDDENSGDPGAPDTGDPDVVNPDTDGGGDDADGGQLTFPQYVQDTITNKTADNTAPDLEAVWGMLPDNEAHVFPPAFFPP